MGTEVADGLRQFAGQGVDVVPALVVLSVFHDGQVDVGILFANLLEAFIVAAIALSAVTVFQSR